MSRRTTVFRLLGAAAFGGLGAASGYAIGGDQAAIALGLCSAVVALPFRWTHPHRWREIEQAKPVCYGDYPHRHPQEAAERDCPNCLHVVDCEKEVTSGQIVQSLFLGICPDEQTPSIFGWDEVDPIARHFKCQRCEGHWIVRLGRARHMRDYSGFDMEKIK
jgi:hypothetical protein